MEYNKFSDYFEEKWGSSIWPSSNPQDSPVNTYTCKLCGWTFPKQVMGPFRIGHNPFDEVAKMKNEHIQLHLHEKIGKGEE